MITKGALHGERPHGEQHSDQGQCNGCRVGKHVSRIGEQRQTAGQNAADNLYEHKTGDQNKGSDQAALAGMAQLVGMIMFARTMVTLVAVTSTFMFVVIGTHSVTGGMILLYPDPNRCHTAQANEYQRELEYAIRIMRRHCHLIVPE